MIKYLLLIFCFLNNGMSLYAQADKLIIDTSVFNHWGVLRAAAITNDGLYTYHAIANKESDAIQIVTYVSSTKKCWNKQFITLSDAQFTSDNKWLFGIESDSVLLLQLGTDDVKYIGRSGRLLKGQNHDWVSYRTFNPDKQDQLHILDVGTGSEIVLKSVNDYVLSPDLEHLFYVKETKTNNNVTDSLCIYDMITSEQRSISNSISNDILRSLSFDNEGKQICYLVKEQDKTSVWYYKVGMPAAERKVQDGNTFIDTGFVIDAQQRPVFNKGGTKIFFQLIENYTPPAPMENGPHLNVWSYTDSLLKTERGDELERKTSAAVVDVTTGQTIQVSHGGEFLGFNDDFSNYTNYILLVHGGSSDSWWQQKSKFSEYLVSLQDGSRILLKDSLPLFRSFSMSPDEKFVIWFQPVEDSYYSFEIATRKTRNISIGSPASFKNKNSHLQGITADSYGIGGWLKSHEGVLVYDEYDIWQLDPLGVNKPVCLTGGYGANHHIQLRFAEDLFKPADQTYIEANTYVLKAFDDNSKDNGYYSFVLGKADMLRLLTMGPYIYHGLERQSNKSPWLVIRESATEAPNYFITKDLKNFASVSDNQPQKKYNWLTSELIHWTMTDGKKGTGILYKPQNFDPQKKYPVIFQYYETRSVELNQFKEPEAIRDEINIPYFVSRGYIICVPDISFDVDGRSNGESALNAVVSCAEYLGKMSWIDAAKMGLKGHSFSGGTTNYIITHSHLFAAASEGAGVSDATTNYLSLSGGWGGGGSSRMGNEVLSQGRALGGSLWEMGADYFVKASAIYKADQVTTPLLIMHNKRDGAVPWNQAVEMFLSLRRLGKRVWWLDYDNGGHFVVDDDAIDYTIRMTQFFDHYLKGQPPPKWMTQGIPARLKGIDNEYELDTSGTEPQEQPVLYKGKMQLVRDAVSNVEK